MPDQHAKRAVPALAGSGPLNSRLGGATENRISRWREQFKVHPAADVFPMMSDEELAALGEDIKANGLRTPITLWACGKNESGETVYLLLDGRNRMEALNRRGLNLGGLPRSEFCPSNLLEGDKTYPGLVFLPNDVDPVAFVISANIHRRHLPKQQQADLIVAAVKASRQVGEVPKRHVKGKIGSEKDAVKTAVVDAAKEHGIGRRTVERAIAKAEGKTPKPKAKQQTIEEYHDAVGPYATCGYEVNTDPNPDLVAARRRGILHMSAEAKGATEHFHFEDIPPEEIDIEIINACLAAAQAWQDLGIRLRERRLAGDGAR